MPTTLSVHEANAKFSGVLAAVERNAATLTIMRYGRPMARIVPIKRRRARSLSPMSSVAGTIKVNSDFFEDGSGDWKSCHVSSLVSNMTVVTDDRRFPEYGVSVIN